MTKKKILHITQATGGVKTYTAYVLDYADKDLFDFVVIAPADTLFEKFCSDRSVPYYPVNLERGLNPFVNLSILFRIYKIIYKEKPDVIHANSAKGGFLGRLASILTKSNIIYTPHAFSYLSFSGIKRIAFFILEVVAKRWTTLLLAISHSEARKAIYDLGYEKQKVSVILNSINTCMPAFNREPSDHINIRMIGRLTLQKNPLLFLEIANKLSKKFLNLRFSILGAGIHDDLATEINTYLIENNLKDKVSILSWGNPDISKDFIAMADIFVMTSIFEGLPYSLLEAMLSGVPCVVSNVDGNNDVIRNFENGFACVTLNDFCEKLELLITKPTLRDEIGHAGRNFVIKHCDINKNIKQLQQLYILL